MPGGRAGRLDLGGYRIDTGPTVLTMPDLAEEAFAAVGDSLHRRVELVPCTPPTGPASRTAARSTCTPTPTR
ncbi:hypothetical protein LT493_31855 [Streptomyces tricolor]|nr:hypothetical protein [Streptomyces tricolor]